MPIELSHEDKLKIAAMLQDESIRKKLEDIGIILSELAASMTGDADGTNYRENVEEFEAVFEMMFGMVKYHFLEHLTHTYEPSWAKNKIDKWKASISKYENLDSGPKEPK